MTQTTLQHQSMVIEYVDPRTLTRHPANPNKGNVEAIKASLKRNGQYRPLIASSRTQYVVAGNHTLIAVNELGWTEVAVVFLDLTEEQERRILAADNRLAQLSTYDDEGLLDLLQSISGDLEGTGFTPADLDDLEAVLRGAQEITDPATDAHLNETPEEEAARGEQVGAYQPMKAQHIEEMVIILTGGKKEQLIGWLDELRPQWGPHLTNGEIIHAAVARAIETRAEKRSDT